MTAFPRTFAEFAAWIARPLGKILTAIVGIAMTIVGLAMSVTIVLFPIGVTLMLAGVAVFLCGLFAPPTSTDA